MSKKDWPDELIIKAICSAGQEERNQALKHIYTFHYERVLNYVKINGGSVEDGEDVLQDTLFLFDRNLRENRYEGTSSLHTYFFGIAKWRWTTLRRRHEKRGKEIIWQNQHPHEEENYEVRMIGDERRKMIDSLLLKLGTKCKEILKMQSSSFSMEEIAQKLSISSAQQARQDAYKCRLRFKEMVLENPDLLTTLKSWLNG